MTAFPILALADGEPLDPQWIQDITDAVNAHETDLAALDNAAWIDYSASLTVTGTVSNPTKGNSTYTSYYHRGSWITLRTRIVIGSTWGVGSGQYRFSLPVAAHANAVFTVAGPAYVLDLGTANLTGVCNILSTTTIEIHFHNSLSAIGSGGPGTAWAASDEIRFTVQYQPA